MMYIIISGIKDHDIGKYSGLFTLNKPLLQQDHFSGRTQVGI